MLLIKLSEPGWEKSFTREDELRKELYGHICGLCRRGDETEDYKQEPVDENSSIDELLGTACGCEFMVEV
jgi:hypothetical protein